MLNNIQIEDMKQIKRIIIRHGYDAETMKRYFKLVYKLRETITNLRVSPTFDRQPQSLNLHYLPEFKSLTHLEIRISPLRHPGNIDFINILRLCPKLQSLSFMQRYASPPLPLSKKLMVHNNLKHLDLYLGEFPRHYVTFITSCIPPTIDHFTLLVEDAKKNWICSGLAETMLVDQFLAHLGKIKDMKLSLKRIMQQRPHSGYLYHMARTWHFANRIRGRKEKMITKANFQLISPTDYLQCYYQFKIRENKYFDLCLAFHVNPESLEDVPTNDMEDLTMINSIKITPYYNIVLLQFIRYIVKRCTRLSRIFVHSNNSLQADSIIFAPIAMRSDREEETTFPLGHVTTPTEENILFASYSCISLHESFLQSISQMFPKIEAVRITGCDFEGPIIRIDLGGLEHLRRIELDPKQICRKESVLFAVHLEHYGTVNYYFFKRLIQGLQEIMGPFELISMNEGWQEEEDCIVINIFCFKVEELKIQWSFADEIYPTTSGLLIPYTVHPLSDYKSRSFD